MPDTAKDLVRDALIELGIPDATETISGEDADLGLRKLNDLLDEWNADGQTAYASLITAYTLVPSLQPHTIGPTGTFVVTQRPETIDGANLIISGVRTPIGLRNVQQRMALSTPALASALPMSLYYEPAWPNGKIWFYPIIASAYQVELWTRVVLAALTFNDTFTLPPAYKNALLLTLAERLAPAMHVGVSPETKDGARSARSKVFAANTVTPRLATQDAGMPSGGGSGFNYLTGRVC